MRALTHETHLREPMQSEILVDRVIQKIEEKHRLYLEAGYNQPSHDIATGSSTI